jgi:hypothetical protein
MTYEELDCHERHADSRLPTEPSMTIWLPFSTLQT